MALHPRKPDKDILSVSFNQSGECFTCSLTSGFRIFVTYPLRESVRSYILLLLGESFAVATFNVLGYKIFLRAM